MKTTYSIPLPLASEVITVKAEHSARPVRSIAFQDEGVLYARRLLRCTCRQRRGQEPPFTASGAGSISRNLPTRSFNEALQKRPASIAVCVFIILKASFLLAVACFNRWSLLSEGSRWR